MKAVWEIRILSKVCRIRPSKDEARRRLASEDLISFVPMEDLGIGCKTFIPTQERHFGDVSGSYTYFADGDVLLAKITPCFENGKLGIASDLKNGVGFGSSEFIVFRPDSLLSNEWLYYFLTRDSFRNEGAERMLGAVGHKRVSKEFIESYPIPIPPLPEQHRIVKILDEAFENIATAKANAEKSIQNARALFESHLDSIFSNLAQECSNEDTLENLTEVGSPITYGVVKPGGKGEVIFVRGGDIAGGKVLIEQLRTIEKAVSQQYQRTLLRGGELLISLVGQPGQVAIAPQELSGANIARQVGLVRLNSRMNAEFVRYYLQSPSGKKSLHARQSGSVQQVINLGELRVVRVPVPSIDTQNKIVVDIGSSENETRRLESIYQAKIATLDELKKSLLHQAFNGDL